MKSLLLTFLWINCFVIVKGQSPGISGAWYSKDRSRQYIIQQKTGALEAWIVKSDRGADENGKLVLSRLQKKRNRYRGIIHAIADSSFTTVTIKTARKNPNVLILRLKRMMILDATIKWYRNPA